MPQKFFIIPIHDLEASEAELNGFLSSHRIANVERHWVDQGPNSFWSISVDYLHPAPEARVRPGKGNIRSRIDYREVLSPEQFSVFAKLRDLRKEIAQQEAVPVYAVFTNEQLAQMVQQQATNKEGLRKIEGVGDARIEKYAEKILPLLSQLPGGTAP